MDETRRTENPRVGGSIPSLGTSEIKVFHAILSRRIINRNSTTTAPWPRRTAQARCRRTDGAAVLSRGEGARTGRTLPAGSAEQDRPGSASVPSPVCVVVNGSHLGSPDRPYCPCFRLIVHWSLPSPRVPVGPSVPESAKLTRWCCICI
jgi:hypothetical protein